MTLALAFGFDIGIGFDIGVGLFHNSTRSVSPEVDSIDIGKLPLALGIGINTGFGVSPIRW